MEKMKVQVQRVQIYCIFVKPRIGGGDLSHYLLKADRVSNPINFYRESEKVRVCPLFLMKTTFLEEEKG